MRKKPAPVPQRGLWLSACDGSIVNVAHVSRIGVAGDDKAASVVAYLAYGPVPLRRFEGRAGSALEAALVHVRFMEREWLEKHGEVILP